MRESNTPRVKGLARDRRAGHSIHRVADNWPAASCQMHTNLMRPSCNQLATHERGVTLKLRHHLVARLACRAGVGDDHSPAIGKVASERKRDASERGLGHSLHDSEVVLADAASRLIALHRRMHLRRERHHDETGRVLIESGEDARLTPARSRTRHSTLLSSVPDQFL